MALKKCVSCGIPLGGDAKFCPECGATQPEELKCAHCGADMEAGMRFCPECGQAAVAAEGMQQVPPVQPQTAPQVQGAQPQMTQVPSASPQAPTVDVQKPQAAPQSFAPPAPQTFVPPQGAGQPSSPQPFIPPQGAGQPSFGAPAAPPASTGSSQQSPRAGNPLSGALGAMGAGAAGAGAMGEWKEKLLSFEGRLNRKPYVLRLLAVIFINSIIVQIVSFILGLIIAVIADVSPDLGMVLMFFLYAVIFVLGIPAMVIGISLGIRRCHDNDWPGIAILLSFVPVVNFIFGLVLLFKPGTPGPNRFGPDPLQ